MHEAIQDRSLKTRIFTATSKKEKAKMYCYRPIKMNKLYPSNPDFHRFIVAFKQYCKQELKSRKKTFKPYQAF